MKVDTTPFTQDIILRVGGYLMVPFIFMWALYVLIHGALGPGGGFQAGVIMAAAFIFHATVFGVDATKKKLPVKPLAVIASLGLMMYAGIGIAAIMFGGNFLEYGVIPFSVHPEVSSEYGIEVVEIGIGLTVMAIMTSIFYDLAVREE
ncbi:Na(+)/H(+) antiporter subunit B [Methermicoccus shengliensis]|uniref:Na(+)/H(+) antiporter subunit B n=1 Tax=Methermicoccus shengliensis TaxID=660064 RepID=A0A832W0M2_9EURY|nr:Na(+)/H(+) antiporter subunit B [Methermicoccus shengliensis]KUK04770.1 MAG: Na+/H+ antiporter MnhB subunit-like protein [Euryarchaeota archaeon 55_53]KUK29930.1 MAG: Na+/H+ antiporter MnhB subunit-like protein [Methanosarcinales archeaon 56_1174]MDI3487687.1 multicomponent Na+:H+ antiporter subunit [Methanosarcinales archaeon]MDN5295549.1 multicomponent Na+:H+ antiporter subunit [Methanosarcinales archaeon]HIH70310.1 Na(+)/H(+) antiporter subunit B [Methermicoccus shengliensis]